MFYTAVDVSMSVVCVYCCIMVGLDAAWVVPARRFAVIAVGMHISNMQVQSICFCTHDKCMA